LCSEDASENPLTINSVAANELKVGWPAGLVNVVHGGVLVGHLLTPTRVLQCAAIVEALVSSYQASTNVL
jgi:hypothetical protein